MGYSVEEVAKKTGLRPETVQLLLDEGWAVTNKPHGKSTIWISRSAGSPPPFVPHNEPMCDGSCSFFGHHKHGFDCANDCSECGGVCHPNCPAYKECG